MRIRHKVNGGLAVVDDEYGERLVAGNIWERADAPKPVAAPKRRARRSAVKSEEVNDNGE
ncbi:head-tail connector protein [Mycobacterium phage Pistachio]|uniref:Head-to-tail connector protein n=4 Tax=Veracruzvirus TaxID=2948946 RepID=A0A8F3E1A4_9CAUD|nr:head-tail connector protein [Mycobacterium phage HelDan]YP_010060552.1 head-tail connector protein [Mycobacterium phage Pistachio]AQT28417.1 head-to-tail connector protein [Mycobacterium phage Idleandcovert]AVR57001.1 hypothetical protein PBI_PUPPY_17 [Mycobacterium phage Puppy]AVR77427.1 hypothetical protein SEA_TNGUYEN7_16 [Mycobacterium phage TNguyen7]QDP44296.1 hypothetical protein SEA_HEATHEN_16 [Mycobacterium phage Heathen]QWY79557.1 hypothetical protein SEA_SCOUT_16 [Mycobacterium p